VQISRASKTEIKNKQKSSVDVTIRDKSRRHSPSDNTAYHQNKSNSKNSPRIEEERTQQRERDRRRAL
jgi:hypothetical protein